MILVAISAEVTGFERLKEEYESCLTLGKHVTSRDSFVQEIDGFLLQDGYLFRFCKLCIPRTFLRDFLSWEMHAGDLSGHFSQNKTIEAVEHNFYRPSSKRDVVKIVG